MKMADKSRLSARGRGANAGFYFGCNLCVRIFQKNLGILPRSGSIQTWVQLGCNKTSRGLLWALKQAIGAVRFQSVTSEPSAVTAEVASSSLVVPAIHSKRVVALSLKPSRTQKGTFLCPFLCLFCRIPLAFSIFLHGEI